MPKVKQKSVAEDVEEETPLHGVINEEEAKNYRDGLDKIFDNLAKNIQDNIGNVMELAIIDLKTQITNYIPGTEDVDPNGILITIRDPSCLILREPTEGVKEKLGRNYSGFRHPQRQRYHTRHQRRGNLKWTAKTRHRWSFWEPRDSAWIFRTKLWTDGRPIKNTYI